MIGIADLIPQEDFAQFGDIVETSNSGKNYAFVTFMKKEDGQKAMAAMDGRMLHGRQITVKEVTMLNDARWGTTMGATFFAQKLLSITIPS